MHCFSKFSRILVGCCVLALDVTTCCVPRVTLFISKPPSYHFVRNISSCDYTMLKRVCMYVLWWQLFDVICVSYPIRLCLSIILFRPLMGWFVCTLPPRVNSQDMSPVRYWLNYDFYEYETNYYVVLSLTTAYIYVVFYLCAVIRFVGVMTDMFIRNFTPYLWNQYYILVCFRFFLAATKSKLPTWCKPIWCKPICCIHRRNTFQQLLYSVLPMHTVVCVIWCGLQ